MTLLSVILTLFLITDPIGKISLYLESLKQFSPREKNKIITREMVAALFTMFLFAFLGTPLINLIEISAPTIRLSAGLILFLVSIRILFPGTTPAYYQTPIKGKPFIVPLAIPLIASPSLLAMIMLYAHLETYDLILFLAIFISWLFSFLILLFANSLKKLLGENGLYACERLTGMLLVMLAIQQIMEGVKVFLEN